MTESDGFVRFMGNTFELIEGELGDSNFPIVWDIQQTVLSIPQKAVAMVGAFDKLDNRDGTQIYPSAYCHPFITIRKLDDTAELLWEWHGQKPEFSWSSALYSAQIRNPVCLRFRRVLR